jgi:hypothetical protein
VRVWTLVCRLALVATGVALLLGVSIAGVLAYPQPFFANQVAEGRLELYSDQPFEANVARAILADVEARLGRSQLNDGRRHRIFVANAQWRRRLFFLWGFGAGGINFHPVAGGVFLRQADVEADRLLKSDGTPVPPPRTLAYYAAHEIGHDFIAERTGAIANWRLPVWIREGLADYIAFGGDVDVDALLAALRRGDPDLDPKRSGTYARYRLLVAWMLEREGWTVDRLLASGMTQVDAEGRVPRF